MPVNSTHPDYDAMAPDWVRARDVLAGEDAVKAAGEKYLPRITAHSDTEYDAYRQRAAFFNAAARTAEGYAGLIFRRPPFIKVPEAPSNPVGTLMGSRPSATASPNSLATQSPTPSPVRTQSPASSDQVRTLSTASQIKNETQSMGRRGLHPYQEQPPSLDLVRTQSPASLIKNQTQNMGRGGTRPYHGEPSTLSSQLSAFLTDADLLGTSLAGYAKKITAEVLGLGRAGSLLDWEEDTEHRAFVAFYSAEQIINWRMERVRGRMTPTLVVLRERGKRLSPSSSPGQEQDPFMDATVEQIRVLKLVDSNSLSAFGGEGKGEVASAGPSTLNSQLSTSPRACVVELWQLQSSEKSKKPQWVMVETRVPLRAGKPLPLIPFVFHGPRHSTPEPDKPPLNDIMAINLDHYRLNADYKHGLHYTALPTAWVSGFSADAVLRIGASTAWVSEQPGATAGYLEFTGQGLTSFERAMDRDERLMAVLGSRLLEDQKKVGETAQAIELRQSGENSVLSSIAASVSDSLTQVLRWVYWWNSTEETPDLVPDNQVLLTLNTDFSLKGLSSNEIQSIVSAWQANAISRETMLELFRKGEILPDGRTNEDEIKLLEAK